MTTKLALIAFAIGCAIGAVISLWRAYRRRHRAEQMQRRAVQLAVDALADRQDAEAAEDDQRIRDNLDI